MRSGAARGFLTLLAVVACFAAACGESTPATIGSGLRVAPAQVPAAPPDIAAAVAAASPPAPRVAPAGAGRRATSATVLAVPVERGRIVIPRIGVDLQTYEGVDPWTLRHGPGHWPISARPGQPG